MRRSPLVLLLTALVALPAFSAASGARGVNADSDLALLALVFTADWCPHCEVLDPKLRAVEDELQTMGVEMVVLDLSNAASRRRARAEASAGGYADVFGRYEGATGYALLMSARSHEVLDRLTSTDTEADIRRKVCAALVHA